MSTLSKKDRISLCSFTFSDGRRCRTPRIRNHPHFCLYHAQKEARARAAEKLGKDLAYFFSGEYLSACDLSTTLSRLIPAVVRGDVKPRTARTIAYLAQTLLQSIQLAQHEYINAFSTDGWRNVIRKSVNDNHDYRYPPTHPACPVYPEPRREPRRAPTPPSHVGAGLQTGAVQAPQPAAPVSPACHPERSASFANGGEGPASSPTPAPTPAAPSHTACHPERSEGSHPGPATQPTSTPASAQAPSLTPAPAESPANYHSERSAHSASRMVLREEESASSSSPAPSPSRAPEQPTPTPPQIAPLDHPFISEALPPRIRRRLHRSI